MPYVSSVERIGLKKGLQQGMHKGEEKGKIALLLRQLEQKIGGEVDASVRKRLADVETSTHRRPLSRR